MTMPLAEPIVRPARETRTRCGFCGNTGKPADTFVVDWMIQLICGDCVASHDWSDWIFDPVLNAYQHA